MPLISNIIRAFFPPVCVHCQREGAWLCVAAAADLAAATPLIDTVRIPGVDRTVLRGSYDHPVLQAVILKMKYHYWTGLAEILPVVLDPLTPALAKSEDTALVPVPLHTRRHRERGFNQSLLLAQALNRLTGIPVCQALIRHRSTQPQAQLKESARLTNVADAFARNPRIDKIPRSAILVDDVLTTGSTFRECASVLRRHGTEHITAVALAKG